MNNNAASSDPYEISRRPVSSGGVPTEKNGEAPLAQPPNNEILPLRLLSNDFESLFDSEDSSFSDAKLALGSGHEIPVHRCVLSSRSRFFKRLFSLGKHREGDGSVLKLDMNEIARDYEVGFDALVAILAYLYSGKIREPPQGVKKCVDDECAHATCRPVVNFTVEVLYLAFTFRIPYLTAMYQRRLLDILDNAAMEEFLIILRVADICRETCETLADKCMQIILESDVDVFVLQKALPGHTVKSILELRKQFGFDSRNFPDKQAEKIHRALDMDDVELVRMLLKEGRTDLDATLGLHYAVRYCDLNTALEIIDLQLADVNRKDSSGYTVLHHAAVSQEPAIILSLLDKGAQPTDLTLDGRKALQVSKQLTKLIDYNNAMENRRAYSKERLCIELLEQAERSHPLLAETSLSLIMRGYDLRMKLLHLENRVSLGKLMFPAEANVATDSARLNCTSMVPLAVLRSDYSVASNRTPMGLKEQHLKRLAALMKAVELGLRFFPRCAEVLTNLMNPEVDLALIESGTEEERARKKQRHMEIQEILRKVFDEHEMEF